MRCGPGRLAAEADREVHHPEALGEGGARHRPLSLPAQLPGGHQRPSGHGGTGGQGVAGGKAEAAAGGCPTKAAGEAACAAEVAGGEVRGAAGAEAHGAGGARLLWFFKDFHPFPSLVVVFDSFYVGIEGFWRAFGTFSGER